MRHYNRRNALALVATVPVAVAIGGSAALTAQGDDPLFRLIHLYRVHIKAICDNCDVRDMDDGELDARCDAADVFLKEAAASPALTAAGAMAALDLALEDDDSRYYVSRRYGNALLKAVRDYIERGRL